MSELRRRDHDEELLTSIDQSHRNVEFGQIELSPVIDIRQIPITKQPLISETRKASQNTLGLTKSSSNPPSPAPPAQTPPSPSHHR